MEPNTGWRNKFFNFKMCNGVVEQRVEDGNIVVTGQLKPDMMPNSWLCSGLQIQLTEMVVSQGSGLPYANPEMAFDRSINVGAVKANGSFDKIQSSVSKRLLRRSWITLHSTTGPR